MNAMANRTSFADRFVQWSARIAAVAAVVAVTIYALTFREHSFGTDPADFAQFGDYFAGVLNPLVALFALVALVWSVRIQREELSASTSALREQKELSDRQLSVQMFFRLLAVRNEQVRSIVVWELAGQLYTSPPPLPASELRGYLGIAEIERRVLGDINQHVNLDSKRLEWLLAALEPYEPILSGIFQTGKVLVFFVDSMVSDVDKQHCAATIAGIMSAAELRLMALWLAAPTNERAFFAAESIALFRHISPAWFRKDLGKVVIARQND